jgi:hypothetical protein
MNQSNKKLLDTFTLDTLPNLDVAVLGALELFSEVSLPAVPAVADKHPLIIGSGNAELTGKILFRKYPDAHFANEGLYESLLADADEVVLVSASGGKDAVSIARKVKEQGITQWLLTANKDALARAFVAEDHIVVFPKNREPYTYNTSTYLGMIFAETKENPHELYSFIEEQVVPVVPTNLSSYDSFLIIIPSEFELVKEMFLTKFDELFGGVISGRVVTEGEVRHAKTVVPSPTELYINLGTKEDVFEDGRAHIMISLPENVSFGAIISIGYFFIGKIQAQHPPYFKEHLVEYTETASKSFGQAINPIVE